MSESYDKTVVALLGPGVETFSSQQLNHTGAIMRSVKHLALTPTDKALVITADDREVSAGNMSHDYVIRLAGGPHGTEPEIVVPLRFQKGPIAEAGVNGMTNEALLAIVRDRLEGAQDGPFRCRENELAITAIEEASLWLAKRTLDRMARGVEGQNKP